MAGNNRKQVTMDRGARMLRTALGPAISELLRDPAIVEVMLNPDGRLWVDRLAQGLEDTGKQLTPEDGERIIRLVAHHVGTEVYARAPRVSAELPDTGVRRQGFWDNRRFELTEALVHQGYHFMLRLLGEASGVV